LYYTFIGEKNCDEDSGVTEKIIEAGGGEYTGKPLESQTGTAKSRCVKEKKTNFVGQIFVFGEAMRPPNPPTPQLRRWTKKRTKDTKINFLNSIFLNITLFFFRINLY